MAVAVTRIPLDALEWVPRRLRGKLEIADVGTKAQTDAGANWDHHDVVRGKRRNPKPANEVGRALDPRKAFINRLGGGKIVHQHHGPGAVTAKIPADRRSLPVNFEVAGILREKRAFAVAQSSDERGAAFLAKNISVRQSPTAHRFFNHSGEAARHAAKEPVSSIDQLFRLVPPRLGSNRGRCGCATDQSNGEGNLTQKGAHQGLLKNCVGPLNPLLTRML